MAVKKSTEPVVSGEPISTWRERLASPNFEQRFDTLQALQNSGKRGLTGLTLLMDDVAALLDDKVSVVRSAAAWALGNLGAEAASLAPQLGKALLRTAKPDKAAKEFTLSGHSWGSDKQAGLIADSLAHLGSAGVAPLMAALQNRSATIRLNAAAGLGDIGPAASGAVPDLVEALADKHPRVRMCAAGALGQIATHPRLAVPALIRLLADRDHETQRSALTSLGDYGPAAASAVPMLLPFLDEDIDWPWWHFLTAEALGKIGPAASIAMKPLQNLLPCKNKRIHKQVEQAINLISASPSQPKVAKSSKQSGRAKR